MNFLRRYSRAFIGATTLTGASVLRMRSLYRAEEPGKDAVAAESNPSEASQVSEEETEDPAVTAMHQQRAAEFGYVIPERECPMCEFIRKGPCYREYFAYDKCHKAETEAGSSKEDEAKVCMPLFASMFDCMKQNMDYYGPMVNYFEKSDEDEDDASSHATEGQTADNPVLDVTDSSDAIEPPRRVWKYNDQGKLEYEYQISE